MNVLWNIIYITTVSLLSICFIVTPCTIIALALITALRKKFFSSSTSTSSSDVKSWKEYKTSLYSGRVSHTRFVPVRHSFSYPFFFSCLDLDEVEDLFLSSEEKHPHNNNNKSSSLWPLNIFMKFRIEDHLKNGEGLTTKTTDERNIKERIRNLVSERTQGKYKPACDQTILLLTHLSYFGYCFNPVSFYYILKDKEETCNTTKTTIKVKNDTNIEAIVAEVSNTPWNEMQCYVLHPDSIDITDVREGRSKEGDHQVVNNTTQASTTKSINYIFPKTFHVSPFMDMNHIYDWTFFSLTQEQILVSTSMIHKTENKLFFNANFNIHRQTFHPLLLSYQILRWPVYCMIMQIWIHFEAIRLLIKGVEFVPHPKETETWVSNLIAFVMSPYFAFQEWSNKRSKRD